MARNTSFGCEHGSGFDHCDQAALASPVIDGVVAYWSGLSGAAAFPARAQIDPVDIPELLPQMVLIDVLPARGFRVRLMGTGVTAANTRDLTGRRLEDCGLGEDYDGFRTAFETVVEGGEPVFVRHRVHWQRREWRGFKMAVLPLGADGEAVDMLLLAVEISDGPLPGADGR